MIRPYHPDDLEALWEMTVVCFDGVCIDQNIERILGPLGESRWQDRKATHVDEDAAANPDGVFVYEELGRVVGYISTRLNRQDRLI